MARNARRRRSSFKALPQIGNTTEQCAPVENLFNELGARGAFVLNINVFGSNGRSAHASLVETARRWQYRVISFNMKDPLLAQRTLDDYGEAGWLLHQVYSQGAHNYATAAVLIRPGQAINEEELEAGPEQDASETSELGELANNVAQGALETVGT